MKLMKVICVLALTLMIGTIVYAETQSVKISGDLTMRSILRRNYDLNNDDAGNQVVSNDYASYLMSTTEVQIDADLTDNVSGVVRIVNQKPWGDENVSDNNVDADAEMTLQGIAADDLFDVGIDLAYIELKEFLYSPLTLRIGRQDLWFGRGFIVGRNQRDPGANLWAQEYTAIESFDAVRATLDYYPWTIDGIFAKIEENARRADDDRALYGVNIGYVFDVYEAEAEAYWFYQQDRNPGRGVGGSISTLNGTDENDVHTFGARGSMDPIEDWTIAVEGAYQTGQYLGIALQEDRRKRSAWAIDAMVECRYFKDRYAWKPVLGVEYIFYSGNEHDGDVAVNNNGTYSGWDPMFRGKFDTAIREFMNVYYQTTQNSGPSTTNQHQILVMGSLEPTDSLTLEGRYAHFWLDEPWSNQFDKKDIGDEIDLQATWDYTEDVSFGLLTAWFFPGNHFGSGRDDVATDVVGTVKLSF